MHGPFNLYCSPYLWVQSIFMNGIGKLTPDQSDSVIVQEQVVDPSLSRHFWCFAT